MESPTIPGLSLEAIRGALPGGRVGRSLQIYGEVDSTNTRLVRLARAGAPDGTVVLADTQTAPRARRGTTWFSPPGVNLYASVLFRGGLVAADVPVFAFITSLAVVDTVDALGLHASIKWPNDVLVDGRKIAGALVECDLRGDIVEHVVLGVGVNVNVEPAELLTALGPAARFATSVAAMLGRRVDRNAFAAAYLRSLDSWAAVHARRGPSAVLAAWRDRDILGGRRVEVREGGALFEGRALGVAASGRLVVGDIGGRHHEVVAGEVRLVD